jgi:hypothetical protein
LGKWLQRVCCDRGWQLIVKYGTDRQIYETIRTRAPNAIIAVEVDRPPPPVVAAATAPVFHQSPDRTKN